MTCAVHWFWLYTKVLAQVEYQTQSEKKDRKGANEEPKRIEKIDSNESKEMSRAVIIFKENITSNFQANDSWKPQKYYFSYKLQSER